MTASPATPATPATSAAPPAPVHTSLELPPKATFGHAVHSEWTKFRSVRATFWCLLLAAVLGVGLVVLVAAISANRYHSDPTLHLGWNPVDRSLRPLLIAQLVFAVFGVITVTSEYATGMISTSMAAVPRRGRLMASKLLVFTVVAFIAGQVISFVSFSLAQFLFHGQAPSVSISQHLILRVVIGAGLYLTLLGLTGAAFGFLLRHAAAGIAVMVGIMLVLPAIVLALPTSWEQPIEEFWPTQAGQQVYALGHGSHNLPAWLGFGWMALFAVVILAISYTVLQSRDA